MCRLGYLMTFYQQLTTCNVESEMVRWIRLVSPVLCSH